MKYKILGAAVAGSTVILVALFSLLNRNDKENNIPVMASPEKLMNQEGSEPPGAHIYWKNSEHELVLFDNPLLLWEESLFLDNSGFTAMSGSETDGVDGYGIGSDTSEETGEKTDSNGSNYDTLEGDEDEYTNLAIADVTDYVNVRSLPSTEGEILGKIYDGAVAQIQDVAGEDNEWFKVVSGKVEGYIKAEYFIYGDAAVQVIDEYVTRYVEVKADRLNVRKEPDIESGRVGYLDHGEKALLIENQGEWDKVQYADGEQGYVSAEYVLEVEEFTYARTIVEERAEQERLRELEERRHASEDKKPEDTNMTATNPSVGTSGDMRTDIVNYAMQFLGKPYVHGGNSLEEGTDCSGFTSLIYAAFGYSVGRTPSGQLSGAGRSIDYSNIQPGDIICYGKNGKCTHVALYIGNGQIIHEANSQKGVVIYQADYDTILGVKNVID